MEVNYLLLFYLCTYLHTFTYIYPYILFYPKITNEMRKFFRECLNIILLYEGSLMIRSVKRLCHLSMHKKIWLIDWLMIEKDLDVLLYWKDFYYPGNAVPWDNVVNLNKLFKKARAEHSVWDRLRQLFKNLYKT